MNLYSQIFQDSKITSAIAQGQMLLEKAEEAEAFISEKARQAFVSEKGVDLANRVYDLNEAGKDLIRYARNGSTFCRHFLEVAGLVQIEELYEKLALLLDGKCHSNSSDCLLSTVWNIPKIDKTSGLEFLGFSAVRYKQYEHPDFYVSRSRKLAQISDALHLIIKPQDFNSIPSDVRQSGWTNGVSFRELVLAYNENPDSHLRPSKAEGHIWRQYSVHEKGVQYFERQEPTVLADPAVCVISVILESEGVNGPPIFFHSSYAPPRTVQAPLILRCSDGRRINFDKDRIDVKLTQCLDLVAQVICKSPALEFSRLSYGRGTSQSRAQGRFA